MQHKYDNVTSIVYENIIAYSRTSACYYTFYHRVICVTVLRSTYIDSERRANKKDLVTYVLLSLYLLFCHARETLFCYSVILNSS